MEQLTLFSSKKISAAGLNHFDILMEDEEYLCQVPQLSLDHIKLLSRKTISGLLDTTFQPGFFTVTFTLPLYIPLASNILDWVRITTGCDTIDAILRGGVPVSRLIEIVGPSGAGKTQLCLQLALMVQLPKELRGLNKGAVYICTENCFPSKRIFQLSNAFMAKYTEYKINFMDNIFIKHVSNYEQLKMCCDIQLPRLLLRHNIGLIVIDSIAGIFRSEDDHVNYAERSRQFYKIYRGLVKLTHKYEIALVNTNQVLENIETNKLEPCLGLAWSNLLTCRLWISRDIEKIRSLAVMFAPDLPDAKCNFIITESGLSSVRN
ncbi:hypothetical protein FQA39_LY06793 [Lamprigera yunnana]|nr:hypothetical protein FQA39_LY06793 [Lamprigera yunnana]